MTKLGDYVLSGQEINSNVVRSIDGASSSEGGGGSSDFSTVEITINNSVESKGSVTIYIGTSSEGDGYVGLIFDPSSNDEFLTTINPSVAAGSSTTLHGYILNGKSIMAYDPNDQTLGVLQSVEGNAEVRTVEGYTAVYISGNCTLNIKGDK
jgi:hypothetical protein